MRFKVSKIYVSVIPIWVIGFVIGFIGAVMGIGGGFMLVPALIYLIRVPTGVVIGTSMVLTLVTMAYATIIHAATNHLVDALLALILMIGGVIGAQFGARTGQSSAASSCGSCSASWCCWSVFASPTTSWCSRPTSTPCGKWRSRHERAAQHRARGARRARARLRRPRRSGWSPRSRPRAC